jgi:hypothetical protein
MSQLETDTSITRSPGSCPQCEALLKLRDRVWNINTRKYVRVLECIQCHKLVWSD